MKKRNERMKNDKNEERKKMMNERMNECINVVSYLMAYV
jgi:hypothetical protein